MKAIKIPGGRLQNGQYFPRKENPMSNPHYNIARDGAEKRTVAAPIKPGMVRATKGDLHPYLHGIAVQDEPNVGLKSHERPIPVHDHMANSRSPIPDPADDPKNILAEAENLGPARK
jgi:hypothetical protein